MKLSKINHEETCLKNTKLIKEIVCRTFVTSLIPWLLVIMHGKQKCLHVPVTDFVMRFYPYPRV